MATNDGVKPERPDVPRESASRGNRRGPTGAAGLPKLAAPFHISAVRWPRPVGPENLVGGWIDAKSAVERQPYGTRHDCINDTAWKERRTFGADNSPTRKSHKYEPVCRLGIFGTHRDSVFTHRRGLRFPQARASGPESMQPSRPVQLW